MNRERYGKIAGPEDQGRAFFLSGASSVSAMRAHPAL